MHRLRSIHGRCEYSKRVRGRVSPAVNCPRQPTYSLSPPALPEQIWTLVARQPITSSSGYGNLLLCVRVHDEDPS